MKILHAIANLAPRYGGPSKACWEMARAVAQLGHEVSIYTTNQDGPGKLQAPLDRPEYRDGVEIRYFPIQPPRFWGTSLPLALALRRKIPAFQVVHIHSLYLFHDLVAGHLCRRYNIPYLMRPHGTLDPFIHRRHRGRKALMEWAFEHRNIRGAAALHFTTAEEAALAAPFTFQTPGVVVPLGIDPGEFARLPEPGEFRRRYPEIGDKPIILFFGRINFKKGLDILARAFGRLARVRQDVHLVIAGPDSDGWEGRVRAWLAAEGALGRTTFTGMLLGPEKLAVWRDADIFVLPSYSENFGLAVIEAMAAGLPVIISDRVNIWREVQAHRAGRVIPCDAAVLAEQLMELLDHPEAAAAMAQRGKNLVQQQFQWPEIGRRLAETYARIIAEHRAAEPSRGGETSVMMQKRS
ncbi:MAG: glycosyltransferase [Deltaproteobacteria bacterium]|jgi:glycosyltransferase involved in cell wall biosynthesis